MEQTKTITRVRCVCVFGDQKMGGDEPEMRSRFRRRRRRVKGRQRREGKGKVMVVKRRSRVRLDGDLRYGRKARSSQWESCKGANAGKS